MKRKCPGLGDEPGIVLGVVESRFKLRLNLFLRVQFGGCWCCGRWSGILYVGSGPEGGIQVLNEHERNWVTQIALDVMRGGKMPEGLGQEMEEAFRRNAEYFREVRDAMGEEAFSKVTIDVEYDYD